MANINSVYFLRDWSSHGGEYDDVVLPGFDAVYIRR
jgi:hypothetical protein